jgi:hypothetical protein
MISLQGELVIQKRRSSMTDVAVINARAILQRLSNDYRDDRSTFTSHAEAPMGKRRLTGHMVMLMPFTVKESGAHALSPLWQNHMR